MAIPRVRYAEKQILRAADLTGEQTYRMVQRRRHVLAAHGWGIVFGLMLVQPDRIQDHHKDQSEENVFLLQPGLAVDGYGREIRVPKPLRLELQGDDAFDVWLHFAESPLTTPQGGSYPCGPGEHNRWDEGFVLEVEPASTEPIDPWQPPDVIAADRDFAAWDEMPGGPARRWPVYLGRIEIAGSKPPVQSVNRPYVSLVGETVIAPSAETSMDIGAEQGGGWRFAVSLPNADTGELENERLVLDSFGHNTLRGRIVLQRTQEQVDRTRQADLTLFDREDSEDEYSYGFIFEKPVEEPIQATPWRMYHTKAKQPEQPGQPSPPPVDQLRMELFHPEDRGNPSLYELVIGAAEKVTGVTEEPKFVPRLRIGADGSVTVYGDVTVSGSLTQGPIQADPTDPRFVDAVLEGRERGESANQIDSTLKITISAESPPVTGSSWTYELDVENVGSADLIGVVVRLDVTLPGSTFSETLPPRLILSAGDKMPTIKRVITPEAVGELLVAVTAVGFGPQMRTMSTYEKEEFKISPAADTGNGVS
ncbi:MAG TPA: hypothetical protein VFY26_09010 [Anaerolineales bacterium]|nr:hypothetical protein [Anaerolineales bacterium]